MGCRPLAGPPFLRTAQRRTGSVRLTDNHYSWLCRPWALHTAPGSTQKCELGLNQGGPSEALRARPERGRRGWVGGGRGSPIPECKGNPSRLLLQMTLEASSPLPPPLGRETKLLPREQSLAGLPSSPCPCQRSPYVRHLSALVEQTGALGVLCFLSQWCQTLHLPSVAQHDHQGPLGHCPPP